MQVPTVRNMELKHRSFKGFLEAFNVDIACFQVDSSCSATLRQCTTVLCTRPHECDSARVPLAMDTVPYMQETKLPDSRITKDLACLPGFEVGQAYAGLPGLNSGHAVVHSTCFHLLLQH